MRPEAHDALSRSPGIPAECPVNKIRGGRWLKRLGAAAFIFYLVKGLVWLGIFAAGGAGLLSIGN